MNSVNRLGIKVIVITLIGLGLLYGIYVGIKTWLIPDPVPNQLSAANPSPTPEETITDRDKDGLSDLVENVYHTNPDNPDSDGDSVKDGEEVINGRNPMLAGPNDALTDVPLAKQVADTTTYTGQYLASLPADLNRNEIFEKTRLEAFIASHRGTLLPTLPATAVKKSSETGQTAITKYLDQISSSTNPSIKVVTSKDIDAAFERFYTNPQTDTSLVDVRKTLETNYTTLSAIQTPEATIAVHTKLLQATQALISNVTLLQNMPKDFVGGLIGAKNIEDLGLVFEDISKQIQQLEK